MIDTSVMVAGLVVNHEFHEQARPHVADATEGVVPGIVLAETWAALRRGPWNLAPEVIQQALDPWASRDGVAPTPAEAYLHALREGASLNLGGNIHDLLIALTCAARDLPLVTLDRRQATLARAIPALPVTLLLPDR